MMKVLWIMNKELDTASDRAYIAELSKALAAVGVQTAVAARFRKEKVDYGVDIDYIPTSKFNKLNLLLYLFKLPGYVIKKVHKFKPDIIVLDRPLLSYPFLFIILWLKLNKIRPKIVLDVRSLPTTRIKGKIYRFLMFDLGLKLAGTLFDGFLVITEPMKKHLTKLAKFNKPNFGVWSSAFNAEIFDPKTAGINEHIRNNRKINIIYHGAIAANRNLTELVRAMHYVPSGYHLTLLGEGPLLKELKEIVDREKLQYKVDFLPQVSYTEVPAYLNAADIGVVPIPDTLWFRVSSPIKLLEYMAMGLPIVAPSMEVVTSIGDNNGAIESYNLSAPDLSREIAGSIIRCHEKWGKAYFSQANRDAVIKKFTWQQQANTIKKFFQTAIIEESQKIPVT